MNLNWYNMASMGPMAWNHSSEPMNIPSMHHHLKPRSRTVHQAVQQNAASSPNTTVCQGSGQQQGAITCISKTQIK